MWFVNEMKKLAHDREKWRRALSSWLFKDQQ